MSIKYDKNLAGTQLTDELHNSLGAGFYSLDHDTFFGAGDFNIYTAAASGGTHLIEATHYILHDEDTDLTTETGKTVYTTVKIIDPAYQACDLYFTYKTIGDYNQAIDINDLRTDVTALELKHNLFHIRDEKAQNTAGGTFTLGAWRTRDLNTEKTNEITGASLAANQITLPAGTYDVEWSAPASQVAQHQSKLYDVTNTADLIIGSCEFSSNVGLYAATRSCGHGRITLAGITLIELQHQSIATKAGDGFGRLCNLTTEIYSDIMIWQVS